MVVYVHSSSSAFRAFTSLPTLAFVTRPIISAMSIMSQPKRTGLSITNDWSRFRETLCCNSAGSITECFATTTNEGASELAARCARRSSVAFANASSGPGVRGYICASRLYVWLFNLLHRCCNASGPTAQVRARTWRDTGHKARLMPCVISS
eukprot:COSAG03_NODE_7923_length_855_cov_1.683862_1_plen_152_part_00